MQRKRTSATVVALGQSLLPEAPMPGVLSQINVDGTLTVELFDGRHWTCDLLIAMAASLPTYKIGAKVLVAPMPSGHRPVVLGLVGSFHDIRPSELQIASERQLTLSCGASSIELHADGNVMIRGEDVLVRAKGTKRIRAGTVSIN